MHFWTCRFSFFTMSDLLAQRLCYYGILLTNDNELIQLFDVRHMCTNYGFIIICLNCVPFL